MKVGLIAVGFPNFRYDIAQENLDKTLGRFDQVSMDLITCGKILIDETEINEELRRLKDQHVELLIMQCGTYSYGSVMMKAIELFPITPFLLWGFSEPMLDGFRGLPLNSLCGLNMYGSFLEKVEKKFSYVYGDVDDDEIYEKVLRTVKAVEVKNKMKQTRFCIIGGRVPGFYLSNVDELRFRHEFGPELVYYSVASLLNDIENIDEELVKEQVQLTYGEVAEVSAGLEMIEKSARIYLAIKAFKEANNIDAFTIKCWPEFQALSGCSVCGVVSRLNNEDIMTSCEGDVTGLATMYMQHLLTGEPCFFADLVNINAEGNVKAWHCGPAPVRLARDHSTSKYIEHPTIKQGMGFAVEFKMKLGRLLMLKIKEAKGSYKLFMAAGEGIEEDRDMTANQADIRFDKPAENVLATIMEHGIEHHYALVYEDIEKDLLEVCKWMNIEVVRP